MDDVEILQEIANTGVCPKSGGCAMCPLSMLTRREDNTGYLSCWAAVVGSSWKGVEEVKAAYSTKARELLAQILVERMIREE